MINKVFLVLWSCVWMCTATQAQETSMTASEITKFKTALSSTAKIKTMTADFTQRKKVGYVKNELISSGKFYVRTPDQLAWIYSNPEKYSMVFKDKKVYINDKGKKKVLDVGRSKHFDRISQAIQSNVDADIAQQKELAPSYFQTAQFYIIKLTPLSKTMQKSIKQIVLQFDKADLRIAGIKIEESANGYTHFVLTNRKFNTPLEDTVFAN